MIIIPKVTNIKTGLKLAKEGVQHAIKDECTFPGQMKRLVDDIKETREIGKVFTAGVTDDAAKAEIDRVADGIAAYAKANKLNIIFHTPQECECGHVAGQKTIGVSAYSCGLFNAYTDMKFIDGDVNHITQFKGEKLTADDTFTRRVFRSVEEMTDSINRERRHDYDSSFIGVYDRALKEQSKKVATKTKSIFDKGVDSVKKYIRKEIKFIKDEFTGKGTSDY